jgi:RNA polymerase sigma-70 factor (ECF subfamily)
MERMSLRQVRPRLRVVAERPEPSETRVAARDDSELLACVREGDSSAAFELHDRLRPRVEQTIWRLLGRGDHDAEDLLQQAMIEIITSCDRFRGESSLDAWAAGIAANVVYAHIRRRMLERRVFPAPPAGWDEPVTDSGSRIAAARDMLRRIRKHLDEIDEVKAWTFLLHDVCGFDLREIAGITETSVAAAQSRLVRGRREIHERIAADPELSEFLEKSEGDR